MMDGRPLFPQGHHPVRLGYSIDGLCEVTPLSRTENPVRYYYIDFDLSIRFAEGEPHLALGDVGREDKVPELSSDIPYNPFKVDVFALGNMYYKEFYLVCCFKSGDYFGAGYSLSEFYRNSITWILCYP